MTHLLSKAILRQNFNQRPPVWFMRQAGRYHSHYRKIREKNDFISMCKNPELACEITMGPIDDFDFDAAILFSDLLFPLEALGMGLRYEPGPKLDFSLKSIEDVKKLKNPLQVVHELEFQAEALIKIRNALSKDKGLLGFVGGLATLFFYATKGTHEGGGNDVFKSFEDGRWDFFCEKMIPLLSENIVLQANANPDAVCIFDTSAGVLPFEIYQNKVIPMMMNLIQEFRKKNNKTPLLYYSRETTKKHWDFLKNLDIQAFGVDWRTPISNVLKDYSKDYCIQGNLDPHLLENPSEEFFERGLHDFFKNVLENTTPTERASWIFGLGHGMTPKISEDRVRKTLKIFKEYFQ